MRHHTERARQLRSDATPVERLLWQRLRFRQLGIAFRRQHPIAGHVVDFYAPSIALAVELDGGPHAAQAVSEAFRTDVLRARGVAVLRFWNSEVMANPDGVSATIGRVAAWLATQTPPLAPPLSGEGDPGPVGLPGDLRLVLPAARLEIARPASNR